MTPPPACPYLVHGVSVPGGRGWRMAGRAMTDDALGPAEAAL
jgi:hypothetical protein